MIKFNSIRIKDFMSIKDVTMKYQDNGLVLVLGNNQDTDTSNSNFSGKTNIMTEALSWALFGKGTKEIKQDGTALSSYSADSVIRTDKESCSVEIVFSIDSNNYIIKRTRSTGSPGLILKKDSGENMGSPVTTETQKKIEQLIGFSHSTFIQTCFFGRGSARFSTASDSERKTVLEQVLWMGGIGEAFRKTKKKLKTKTEEREQYQKEISEIKENHDTAKGRVDMAKSSLISWQSNIQQELLFKAKDRDTLLEEHNSLVLEEAELISEIKQGEKDLKSINIDGLRFEQGTSETQKNSVLGRISVLNKEIDSLSVKYKNLNRLSGQECPVCEVPITETSVDSVSTKIISQIAVLEKEKEDTSSQIEEHTKRIEDLKKDIKNASTLNDVNKEKRLKLTGISREIESKLTRSTELSKEIQKLYDSEAFFTKSLKECLEDYNDQLELITAANEIQEEITKEINALEFWVEGFGNRGIKYMLIKEVLPFLTSKCNEYLSILAGQGYRIDFESESFTAKGEVRSKFDVKIQMPGTEGYHAASGGERQRIDFCIALALQSLQAICSGGYCNIFILDEPFESIDETGIENLMEVLKTFSKEHKVAVYVITHLDSLQSHFDNVIQVVKRDGISRIE